MDYGVLAGVYSELESTSKRLKKTFIISKLLKNISDADMEAVMLLLQGRVFPVHDERELGVASKLVVKAISIASGFSTTDIEDKWRKKGDLGMVAEEVMKGKKQNTLFSEELTVKSVFDNFRKIAGIEGIGSVDIKLKTIAKLLSAAKPLESIYVVRTALGELRVGVAEGTLRDAIAWAYLVNPNYDESSESINPEDREAYSKDIDVLQSAIDKTNDFALAAAQARKGLAELEKTKLQVGKPIKVMLAQKVNTASEAFDTVGRPAALEFKYDGFRMQLHKDKNEVLIFTRRLEDVTKQFPEVRKFVLENVKAESCILDAEAAGYDAKTGRYTPFQHISQRIKRKYDIEKIAEELPIELNVFDIIFHDGKDLLSVPFKERRQLLERIIMQKPKKIILAKQIITSSGEEAHEFFEQSVKKGNEGLMFKNLEGIYKPGSRVGFMIKLKSAMDEMDVVVVGAEWGEGKRSGWLTSFTVACRSDDGFLTLGKVGTGLKEKREEGLSFDEITSLLKPHITKTSGRDVEIEPNVVISLRFEEIQKSPSYSSGYALRFPRVVALREDRSPDDVVSLEEVEDAFKNQRKK